MSKAAFTTLCLSAGLMVGCQNPMGQGNAPLKSTQPVVVAPPTTTTATTQKAPVVVDETIATVGETKVGRNELVRPLLEAYGFNLLMLIIQRDMAHDACSQAGIKVTPADVKWEYDWTLGQMFPNLGPQDDREKVLDQFLAQPKPKDQTSTRTELDIIIDTNAYLRKLVEPKISTAVTDQMLQDQFDEEYGAQVQCRTIVVANPQEGTEVRRRLDAGEDFAKVASQISRDPNTKKFGGQMPPFTMNSTRLPDNFKRAAFSLKPGEVSDLVEAGGGYYLIKLDAKVAPKAMKFADVKDSLRQDYQAKLVVEAVKAVRARLAQQALAQLMISDPTLKGEFDKRLQSRDQLIRDREKIREQMEKDKAAKAASPATTAPTTPTAPAATTPAPGSQPAAVAPATKPATPEAPKVVAPVPTPPPAALTQPAAPATKPVATPPAAVVTSAVPPTTKPAPAAPVRATPAPAVAATQPAPVAAPVLPHEPAAPTTKPTTAPSSRPS